MTLQEQIRSNRVRTFVVLLGFAALATALVAAIWFAYQPGVGGLRRRRRDLLRPVRVVLRRQDGRGRVRRASGHEGAGSPSCTARWRTPRSAPACTKTPAVYLINDPAPNAFAAGRNPDHAYVAATTGLLEKLSTRELEGVMAHEIAHIRNRDVRLMSLAAVLVGVIALVADMLMRAHDLRRRPQPREQQPDRR